MDKFVVKKKHVKYGNGIIFSKILTLNHYLGNKKIMYDILSNDPRAFDFLPLTAPFNVIESDYRNIINHAMTFTPLIKTWILKPALGLQGKDIFISNKPEKVIEYIQKKLVTALRVPKAYLGFEEVVGDGKNLSLQDIRFARTINKIQKALIAELNKIAIVHLFLLGFEDIIHNQLIFQNPKDYLHPLQFSHILPDPSINAPNNCFDAILHLVTSQQSENEFSSIVYTSPNIAKKCFEY